MTSNLLYYLLVKLEAYRYQILNINSLSKTKPPCLKLALTTVNIFQNQGTFSTVTLSVVLKYLNTR